MAANVAHGRENVAVSFPGNDRKDDLQACHATDDAEDMMQLEVHQRQRLLHVLQVGRRVFQRLA